MARKPQSLSTPMDQMRFQENKAAKAQKSNYRYRDVDVRNSVERRRIHDHVSEADLRSDQFGAPPTRAQLTAVAVLIPVMR